MGKSANLASIIIETLMLLEVIHVFVGYNTNLVSHISLASTILFLFVSEPINCHYTFKKYWDNKDPDKSDEYEKALIISILTLSLGLLNFILKRVETTTIPIDLGNRIIYNFNLSITIGIMYSAVLLATQIDKLFNNPINGVDHSSKLENVHYHTNGYANGHIHNGDAIEI
ncbi:MAG: hypothetical protein PV340_00970 [Wolbachia sp.]|nr:hypothetical protein [Wolbachia sp.]MDD9336186.1 hypothetical protein [Wolbachia sp.]